MGQAGSADATKLANPRSSAIIESPDKDLVDIVGQQQYKQLSSQVAASKATTVVTKAATQTTAVVSTASKTTAETGKVKLGQAVATAASISSSIETSVSFSGSVMTAKNKPVSSISFAAIAASSNENNFGIIPTGPPPVKANMTGPSKGQQPGPGNSSAATSKQQQMKKMSAKSLPVSTTSVTRITAGQVSNYSSLFFASTYFRFFFSQGNSSSIQSVLVVESNNEGVTIKDLNIRLNQASSSCPDQLEYLKPRRGRWLWKNKMKGKGRRKNN